jgi:hypothetical protein
MALWRQKSSPAEVAPWNGGGLRAAAGEVAVKKGTRPGILLSANEVEAGVMPRELRDFGRGELDIVEPFGTGPLVFLARVRAAAPTSLAEQQLRGLPADAVVLLVPEAPPAVVLTSEVRDSFLRWAQTLLS